MVVFGADHVYRMDPRQMWEQHLDGGAGVTVAGIPVPRSEATAFGVIQTADDGRKIEAFLEKPADPPGLPGRPDETFASMGNYVFSTDALLDALHTDAADESSKHDMGGNIVPMLTGQGGAQVYDFQSNEVPGETAETERYWRDVGTIDSYFEAHMDLCEVVPAFNLYNEQLADPHPHPLAPPGQVRPRRRRPGREGDRQHRVERRDRLRRLGERVGALAGRAPAQLGDRSSARCSWTAWTSAAGRSCATRSSTRTSGSGRAWRSASTRTTTAPAGSRSPRRASPSIGKGVEVLK